VNRRRAGCGKQEQVDEEMQKLKKLADDGWFNKSEYDHARTHFFRILVRWILTHYRLPAREEQQ